MIKTTLPNLFDQYSVYENRVTNALLQTISASDHVARAFLRQFVNFDYPSKQRKVEIYSQKRPRRIGDQRSTAADRKSIRTIPDGRIFCDAEDWAIALESKIVPRAVRIEQLVGHLRDIRSFRNRILLVLSPDRSEPEAVQRLRRNRRPVCWHPWTDVHRWTVKLLRSRQIPDYSNRLLLNLKGYLEMDERLSGFQGIDFQEGFDRVQARNILKALMDELHAPVLKSYPKLKYRRDGITIDGTSVWDCFGVKPFTADLHFTVSIEDARTVISLTIPNAAAARWRKLKEIIGDEDLRLQFLSNIETVRRAVPEIWIRIAHRHFKNRRSVVPDANLDFNFDTIGFNKRRKGVREFPAWSEAFQAAVHSKGNANLQLQVQARFVHKDYPRIRSHEFLEVAVKTIGSFGGLYISLSSR